MREQHPIDELFAQALRDGEADPPASLWGRIAAQRQWNHTVLERLRSQWGWLALLLLAGGGTYWMLGTGEGARPVAATASTQGQPPTTLVADADNRTVTIPTSSSADGNWMTDETGTGTGHNGPDGIPAGKEIASGTGDEARHPAPVLASHTDHGPHATDGNTMPRQDPAASLTGNGNKGSVTATFGTVQIGTPTTGVVRVEEMASGRTTPAGHGNGGLSLSLADPLPFGAVAGVERIALLHPALPPPLPGGEPFTALPSILHRPQPAWWIGLTAAPYLETRTWKGDDAEWVRSLQQMETPHHTIALGAMAGLEWRGGWGLATGVEYSGIRYAFNHLDRFRSERDSIVTHVVTFNAVVIDSHADTMVVMTEMERRVAATNRSATIHIPVEGSWHRGWGRWHLGVRLGVGLNFHAMRSGFLLVRTADGTRSVDVGQAKDQTGIGLDAGAALDLGYAFTERLALWASPGYSSGFLSLSPTDGSPFAQHARSGIRFRLTYLFTPAR